MTLNVLYIKVPSNITVSNANVNEIGCMLMGEHIKGIDSVIDTLSLNMKYEPMNHRLSVNLSKIDIDEDSLNRLKLLNNSLNHGIHNGRDSWFMESCEGDAYYYLYVIDDKNDE